MLIDLYPIVNPLGQENLIQTLAAKQKERALEFRSSSSPINILNYPEINSIMLSVLIHLIEKQTNLLLLFTYLF